MGSNSSATTQNTNPILFTFPGITVEPYWFIIVQLLVIQILQRLYNRFACWKSEAKQTWYIALEITVLEEENAKTERPTYSVVDFILSLISLIHFIYTCVRQTYCSSNANSSTWNCYNAYGYRLYNYVLPSVISVLVQNIVQAVNFSKQAEREMTCTRCLKGFLLFSTIASNSLICLVFVPYFITNALPMFIGFFWALIPLLLALLLVYALFITTFVSIITKGQMCEDKYCGGFFMTHCAVGLEVFGCLIMSMAYNYSQYCYFGAGYLPAIIYEFQSRDTTAWGRALSNSSELQVHNVLAFF